jgi:hypothetical protein
MGSSPVDPASYSIAVRQHLDRRPQWSGKPSHFISDSTRALIVIYPSNLSVSRLAMFEVM